MKKLYRYTINNNIIISSLQKLSILDNPNAGYYISRCNWCVNNLFKSRCHRCNGFFYRVDFHAQAYYPLDQNPRYFPIRTTEINSTTDTIFIDIYIKPIFLEV